MRKVVLGADHAGWELKQEVRVHIGHALGYDHVTDLSGEKPREDIDYPKVAELVADIVADEQNDSIGILICGSGMGVCLAANKVKGIRATACYTNSMAAAARRHNNSNVLCLGARISATSLVLEMVDTWLKTPFSDEERYRRRITQVGEIEARQGFL